MKIAQVCNILVYHICQVIIIKIIACVHPNAEQLSFFVRASTSFSLLVTTLHILLRITETINKYQGFHHTDLQVMARQSRAGFSSYFTKSSEFYRNEHSMQTRILIQVDRVILG